MLRWLRQRFGDAVDTQVEQRIATASFEWVRVRIFEDRLEVRFADELQLACERLRGRGLHRIDYRHVIWSLVRKPGGFARYVYREEMFPSLVFRVAYDAIQAAQPGTRGDLEYLRILHLAASTRRSRSH
jgi:hypothetical protein